MKYLIVISLLLSIRGECQNKLTITQKGWLVYRYGDLLAFLPLKDQRNTPTYSNFLLEEKSDGQRLNNLYHAPAKLLIAKTFWIDTYQYDAKSKKDTLVGKFKYYIQPVKYIYTVESVQKDTTDYLAGG